MKKNNTDQTFEPGKVATASGYTWNTNPGPKNEIIFLIFLCRIGSKN